MEKLFKVKIDSSPYRPKNERISGYSYGMQSFWSTRTWPNAIMEQLQSNADSSINSLPSNCSCFNANFNCTVNLSEQGRHVYVDSRLHATLTECINLGKVTHFVLLSVPMVHIRLLDTQASIHYVCYQRKSNKAYGWDQERDNGLATRHETLDRPGTRPIVFVLSLTIALSRTWPGYSILFSISPGGNLI